MIPEFGLLALILAMSLAFLQSVLPAYGLRHNQVAFINCARSLSLGQMFFLTLALISLTYAFCADDFSVNYVAQHSNSSLPLLYKVGALWGGHEGSLLLWTFILSMWMSAFALKSRALDKHFSARVLQVLGVLNAGLILFQVATSNPFIRSLPAFPIDGRDLNPVLQDFALMIHPPILYLGYVGLSLPWAFAVAALIDNKHTLAHMRFLKPWALGAWCALSLGITLGSWWAYYELGWGGWWFWDAVENASFMPWLVCTALLHSLQICIHKKAFHFWVYFLSLSGFFLSILGTFLIRSGVLSSVHAFALDPGRGIYLLIFLASILTWAFVLFVYRINPGHKGQPLQAKTREAWLLVASVLLVFACISILLGTLFPIIFELCTDQKVSVGFPYFNMVFVPTALITSFLLPFGVRAQWGGQKLRRYPTLCASLSLAIFCGFFLIGQKALLEALGIALSFWIIATTLEQIHLKKKQFNWSMGLAHLGLALSVLGISVSVFESLEREVLLKPGETVGLGPFTIEMDRVSLVQGANYLSHQASVKVARRGQARRLYPEKRTFLIQEQTMTETAIWPYWRGDIYLALGDAYQNNAWSMRLQYKPMVRFIWLGGILMTLACGQNLMKKARV